MQRITSPHSRGAARFLAAAASLTIIGGIATPAEAEPVYGLTTQGSLISFDSATPGTVSSPIPITGLVGGDTLIGIDIRPANGQLYALGLSGLTNTLYVVNPTTGAATAVGPVTGLAFPITSTIGLDFNPLVDRLRAVDSSDANVRIDPTTAVATIDTQLSYQAGDPNFGINPSISGLAYTNNFAGTSSTSLYGIDYNLDILTLLLNPNSGLLTTVGPLGFDFGADAGFDISGLTGTAYLTVTSPAGASSNLFTVNLTTGAATLVGGTGGSVELRSIAVPIGQAPPGVPEPSAWAMILIGFGAIGAAMRRTQKASAQPA